MKKRFIKWFCLIFAGMFSAAICTFFLWEHSLPLEQGSITVVAISDTVSIVDYAAIPSGEAVSRRISQESPDFPPLWSQLAELKYTCCIHTLFSGSLPDGKSGMDFYISANGKTLYLPDKEHIVINGRVFKVKSSNIFDCCQKIMNEESREK